MLSKYTLHKLKQVRFIDKGIYGEVFKDTGEKYYSVIMDLSNENGISNDLRFDMTQDSLNSLLKNNGLYYDKNKYEYLTVEKYEANELQLNNMSKIKYTEANKKAIEIIKRAMQDEIDKGGK